MGRVRLAGCGSGASLWLPALLLLLLLTVGVLVGTFALFYRVSSHLFSPNSLLSRHLWRFTSSPDAIAKYGRNRSFPSGKLYKAMLRSCAAGYISLVTKQFGFIGQLVTFSPQGLKKMMERADKRESLAKFIICLCVWAVN